jgi:protein SCO1/2
MLGSVAICAEPKVAGMSSTEQARELKDVGIDEHLGGALDLSMKFKDEDGKEVTLGSFYDGTHPVVISPVYFSCPGLCNFHLNGVVDAIKSVDWKVGKQFQYIALSFDTKETPELAQKKKASYMKMYGHPGSEGGWHFLTGDPENVKKLTEQIGFKYKWNEETKEWAHASAAVVTTPRGTISRYLHGILFDNKTFKLALVEAGEGKVGTFVDRMVWYCFHYDPHQSKYTLYAANIMKVGGALIILVMAAILLPVWIRARKGQA